MKNLSFSNPTEFTLGFGTLTGMKYLYSVCVLATFLAIALSNVAVISAVALHKSLQEPMYIFICVLCANGLYGSLAFFPSLFVNLISQTQTISYTKCLAQVFCLNTYTGCEFSILTIMALDRYISICYPLRYKTIMSSTTVIKLTIASWLVVIMPFTAHFTLTLLLPLCNSTILKIYCDNWSVVRLSCIDTTWSQISGLILTVGFLVLLPGLILFSYIVILRVCAKSSKQFRAKAWRTCAPHLICITNFITDRLFEVVLHRVELKNFPFPFMIFMSLYVYVVPPLLNPVIYGMKMSEIRVKIVFLILDTIIPGYGTK